MVKVRNNIDKSLLAGGIPALWLEQMQLERDAEARLSQRRPWSSRYEGLRPSAGSLGAFSGFSGPQTWL